MESGRCCEWRLAVIESLRAWAGGRVEGIDVMEMYLPMVFGDPTLFVLVVRNGRRWK